MNRKDKRMARVRQPQPARQEQGAILSRYMLYLKGEHMVKKAQNPGTPDYTVLTARECICDGAC